MRDFTDSTLWRISAYERQRAETGRSGFAGLDTTTLLPSTLSAELSRLELGQRSGDPLEVLAACVRQRESALVLLRHRDMVWPLTLFPQQNLYHLPRSIIESLQVDHRDLEVISVEPPGLRLPGHVVHEGHAERPGYRPLPPLLWAFALHTAHASVLQDIGGRAAYRASSDALHEGVVLPGALGAALQRLHAKTASLADIASWPGMDRERAARLLNGAYLQGGLIVLRAHPAAQRAAAGHRGLLGWWRPRG